MKLRNLTLALAMAALLPTFAYASDDTDAIRASFDRSLNHEIAVKYSPAAMTDADPLDAINITLNKEPDSVLASFERDLYREPAVPQVVQVRGEADPLDVIYVVLRGKESRQVCVYAAHDPKHDVSAC